MEKSDIEKWEYTFDEWYSMARRNIKITSKLIQDIKSGEAKRGFTYNWVLIGQSWLENESINKYLNSKTITECKRLYGEFEELQKEHFPISADIDKLPARKQDEMAREMRYGMFDDHRFLVIYNNKLDLEKRIFTQLEERKEPAIKPKNQKF